MKSAVFVLLAVALFVASCNAQGKPALWGRNYLNDTLVYTERVQLTGIWLLEREQDVFYPPKGIVTDRWITSVRAFDNKSNGSGANVTVISGGLHQTSVQLRFRSQRGQGVDYSVEIYTAPCYNVW